MTEIPDQLCVSIAVSSGKIAASVLPPAVGASSKTSALSSTGPAASSCNTRSDRQPSVLTMWCTTTGCSRSSAELTATPRLGVFPHNRQTLRKAIHGYRLPQLVGQSLAVSQHHRQTLRKAI